MHRRLTTWDIEPGKEPRVVPDLATDTGKATDGGRTWTYTLKPGLKLSDGSPITSADIKYGLERSFAPELSGGLGYHKTLLVGGDNYTGPYKGKELDSIETPDDRTIVFKLEHAVRRLAVDRVDAGVRAGAEERGHQARDLRQRPGRRPGPTRSRATSPAPRSPSSATRSGAPRPTTSAPAARTPWCSSSARTTPSRRSS